jgi:hypothetical protein
MKTSEMRAMRRIMGITHPASMHGEFMQSKLGDIIKVNGNTYTVLSELSKKRRSTTVVFKAVPGLRYSERFCTVTIKDVSTFEKLGASNAEDLSKMVDLMNGVIQKIDKHVREKSNENLSLVQWHQSRYEWGVTCQNGEDAFSGDMVNVKFSNGVFKMRIKSVAGTNDTCQIMVVDPRKAPGSRGRGMDAKTILSKIQS